MNTKAKETPRTPVREDTEVRERRHKGMRANTKFDIPEHFKQAGSDYNWKNHEVRGQPDWAAAKFNEDQGWRPVTHDQMPGLFAPPGTTGSVIVEDMILMERPLPLSIEARREDLQRAREATRSAERRLAETQPGEADRTRVSVGHSVEPMAVPD